MKLGTRLLISLLSTVILIMVVYAGWALIEIQNTLAPEAARSLTAYSTALGFALDQIADDSARIPSLVRALGKEPNVYGVMVYDTLGRTLYSSIPREAVGPGRAAAIQRVLQTARPDTLDRDIEDQRVISVLRPVLRPDGRPRGVVEVAHRLSFIDDQLEGLRRRFALNTLSLIVAVTLVTLWFVRRVVGAPMARLVVAARTVGGGDLSHRVSEDPHAGEIAEVAHEFNTMAAGLEQARVEAARQADDRISLERRLRETEKMAEIGNLAAGLAHEVAAPLNVISGRAELMLQTSPEPEVRERHLRIIVRQIERITTIVRNLLDYAKHHEARSEEVDLAQVIEAASTLLETEMQRAGIEYSVRLDGPLPVMGDPDLLHQLFVNLMVNAIQAMEGAQSVPRRISVEGAGGESRLAVTVSDTGPGIAEDVAARIFSPFFTTKARGTGLGLAVARRIAEEHGGALVVERAEGGARFLVSLPARVAARVAARA